MYRIICLNCKNNNDFIKAEERPIECGYCFESISSNLEMIEIPNVTKGNLIGIKLIYQQTSETLIIETPHCVLGRENTGSDLLGKILFKGNPVISRKHCSLTLIDGVYWIKDEGSSNGTFFGTDKLDCKQNPQALIDGSLVYLGRETFLAQYIYEKIIDSSKQLNPEISVVKDEEKQKPGTAEEKQQRIYRCNEGCGFESEIYHEICPKCYTCNSLIEVNQ